MVTTLLSGALKLPAFFLAVFCMYWSPSLACIVYYIKFANLTGMRNDPYSWCVLVLPLSDCA